MSHSVVVQMLAVVKFHPFLLFFLVHSPFIFCLVFTSKFDLTLASIYPHPFSVSWFHCLAPVISLLPTPILNSHFSRLSYLKAVSPFFFSQSHMFFVSVVLCPTFTSFYSPFQLPMTFSPSHVCPFNVSICAVSSQFLWVSFSPTCLTLVSSLFFLFIALSLSIFLFYQRSCLPLCPKLSKPFL